MRSDNIFWIADENPYPMNDIVETIKTLLSVEFGRECSPYNLYLSSVLGDIAHAADYTLQFFGLYQQKIHVLSKMNKTTACSIDKSKCILGTLQKLLCMKECVKVLKRFYKNGI